MAEKVEWLGAETYVEATLCSVGEATEMGLMDINIEWSINPEISVG